MAVNIVNLTTKVAIGNNADIDAAGAINLDAETSIVTLDIFDDDVPVIGNISVSSVVIGGALSNGNVAIGGSVLVDIITDITHATIGTGSSINAGNVGGSSQDLTLSASDSTSLTNGAGGLGGTTGSVGIGAGVVVTVLTKDTRAGIGNGANVHAGGDISITTDSTENLLIVAASIGASTTAGISASIIVAVLDVGSRAYVASSTANPSTAMATGNLTVEADDSADIKLLAGGLAFGSTAGIGASSATLVRTATVLAYIGSETSPNADTGAQLAAKGAQGLKVDAAQTGDVLLLAIGGGGGSTAGVAGSATIDILTDSTHAYIGPGATINETNTGAAASQSIAVAATDTTDIISIAGALAVGGTAGVGVGVDVQVIDKSTKAWIGRSTTAKVRGNITVDATSSEDILSVSAGAAVSGTAAVTVNAGVSVLTITTQAYVDGGPLVSDGSILNAGGSIRVAASEITELQVISGNLSVSGSASIGAAAAVPVVTKTTQSWIGDNSVVIAKGALELTAATGDSSSSIQETRFRPSTDVNTTTDVITLPYAHGFEDGDKVVYYSGGVLDDPATPADESTDAIPGLKNGGVYYVDLDGGTLAPNQLRLKTILNPLDFGRAGDGTGHSLGGCGFDSADVDGDTIDCGAAHGLSTGDSVEYSEGTGSGPSGLQDGLTYYAIVVSGTEIKLALSKIDTADAIVNLSGPLPTRRNHRIVSALSAEPPSGPALTFDPSLDVNTTANTITLPYEPADGAFAVGNEVRYYAGGGTPIGGLEEGRTYLVKSVSGADNNIITLEHYDEEQGAGTGVTVDLTGPTTGLGTDHSILRANEAPPPNQLELFGLRTTTPGSSGFRGVAVTATNRDDIATIGISGGASNSVAVNVGGAVTIVTATTTATVGDAVTINVDVTDAHPLQSVRVAAANEFEHLGIAGALAISGSVSVAPGADVRVANLTTTAEIGDDAHIRAAENIEVLANAEESIISVAAGLAGGGAVGVGGAVAVIVVNSTTSATVGNDATLYADNNILVSALDDSSVVMVATGLGIGGTVGIGASVGVMTLDKTTTASIGTGATVDAKANGATDLSRIYNDEMAGGEFQTGTMGGLAVQAVSFEDIVGLAISGGGGTVGIAGAVDVIVIGTSTSAGIGGSGSINADRTGLGNQSVNVAAVNRVDSFTLAGGAAAGLVGIAGAVDVGVISADTNASIGSETDIWATHDVGVYALAKKDILTLAVSIGAGFVGASGSVSVWSIGTATDGTYDDGSYEASRDRGTWSAATTYAPGDIVTGSDGNKYELRETETWGLVSQETFDAAVAEDPSLDKGAWTSGANYSEDDLVSRGGKFYRALKNNTGVDPASVGEDPGAWRGISDDERAELIADGSTDHGSWSSGTAYVTGDIVDVDGIHYVATKNGTGDDPTAWGRISDDSLQTENGSAAGQADDSASGTDGSNGYRGIIDGISDDGETDPLTTRISGAKSDANAGIAANAPGGSATEDRLAQDPSGGTVASIGANVTIIAAGDVEVIAEEELTFTGIAGGIQGGVVAIGASILVVNIESNVEATIGAGTSITATGGHVKVDARYDEDIIGVAFTGGGGVVAVGAQVVVINATATQLASFTSGAVPAAANGIDVDAAADRDLFMVTVGIAGGLAAAGAGIGIANLSGNTTANLGNVTDLGSTGPVGTVDVKAFSDVDASSLAVSVQGGGLALSGVVAIITIVGTTSATAGSSGSVGSGGIHVRSDADQDVDVDAINIYGGLIALGATVAIADSDRASLATLSSTAAMSTTGAVTVVAEGHNTADALTPAATVGGISISVMVPIATVSGTTKAEVLGDILSSQSITIRGIGDHTAKAEAIVGSLALFGASGAVAVATIEADADIDAVVGSSSQLTSAGKILVEARLLDKNGAVSKNEATATSRIISGGILGSVGIAVAIAETNGRVHARLDGDATTTNTATDSVKVAAAGHHKAKADTLVISGGLFAGAGAGAVATVGSGADVEARVGLPSTVHTDGAIIVDANGTMQADAISHAGTGGFVAIGVSIPIATVGGTTRAEFSGDVTKGDALTVQAVGDYDAKAFTVPVAVGLIALAGAFAEATVANTATVEAHIGPAVGIQGGADRPNIDVGTGAVLVKASANMYARAEADSVSGGGFSLSVMLPQAETNGVTRAYVRDGSAIKAGSLDVQAGTPGNKVIYKAEAISKNLAIGLIAGVGVDATATTDGVVEAFIGTPVGATVGFTSAGPTPIDIDTKITVRAYSDMDAVANVGAGTGGGVTIAALFPTAEVAGTTRAFVGQGADIVAPGLDIDANGNYNADADTLAVSVSLIDGTVMFADATITGVVDAHVGSAAGDAPIGSDISVIDLTGGALTIDADAVMTATPELFDLTIGGVSVSVLFPTTTLAGVVRAYIGEAVDIDAGSIRIEASAPELKALADATNIGVAALLGLGIIDADATNNSQVEAFIGAHRSINASNVTTDVSVGTGGTIEILIDTAILAEARADSVGISGAVSLGALAPTARVGGYAGTYVRDGVDLVANSLTLKAGDPTVATDRIKMAATADGNAVNVSAVLSGALVIAEAITNGAVEAFIGAPVYRVAGGNPNAKIAVTNGVTIIAASDIDATSTVDAVAVAAISLNILIPTSWAMGTTRAYAGDGTVVHSNGLTITADSDVNASATTEAFQFGLAGGNGAGSEAVVTSRTEAFIGQPVSRSGLGDDPNPGGTRSVDIRAANGTSRGNVTLTATSKSVAFALNKAFASGAISVNVLFPEAKLSGFTSAYVGPNTSLYAGNLTINASDTVASATAQADGVAVGGVTVSSLTSEARISRAVEAFVGDGARVDLGGSALAATATSVNTLANAISKGGSGGLIGIGLFDAKAYIGDDTVFLPPSPASPTDYGAARPTVNLRSVTRAYIGNGAKIVDENDDNQTGAGNVTLTATASSTSNADIGYLGINGIADVLISSVIAETGHDADVYVGDDAVVNISGQLKATASNTAIASPNISSVSVSTISIDVLSAEGKISSDTGAWIGNGAEVTASTIDLDARAGDPTNLATPGHSATVLIDSSGFGAVLRITLLDAKATDTGSVFVRLGPTGGGGSGNRTVVTATGSGGINADAFLNSVIRAEPNFEAFSLLGAAGRAKSIAHGDAEVTARVGGWADIDAGSGDFHLEAEMVGRTEANASGLAGAIGVAVVISFADADHDPTVSTTVGANADITSSGAGDDIEILARHNYGTTGARDNVGAFASASNMAFGLLGAGVDSDVRADAAAAVSTTVDANATFTTPGDIITIAAYNANQSFSSVNSKSGAAVNIGDGTVHATAKGSTTTTFDGSVGSTTTPGAATLDILAVGWTTADATMKSRGGGVVNVAGGDAFATVDPDLTLNFGASSTVVNVARNIAILGHQASDADARADGAGGGAVTVSGFNATISVTPDVEVSLDDTDTVVAGGTISITAQHGGGPASVSDGTVYSVDGANNFVTFTAIGENVPLAHQLSGGETIVYSGSSGGLVNGQAYNVIFRDGTSLYLGNTFNAGSQVSTANDTITFSRDHNFREGERVYYQTNGGGLITGLTDGVRYSVNVIDERTIKLLPDGQSENSRNVSSVNGGTEVVTTTTNHGFTDGLNVTYHAPGPTTLFTSAMVDIGSLGAAGPDFGTSFPLNSTNNNAIFAGQPNSSGTWSPHPYSTGDAVIYRNIDGDGIGLSDGVMYFVRRVPGSNYLITLHTSYCDAVGSAADAGCFLPDGGDAGSDPDARPAGRNPVPLNAGTKTEFIAEQRHSLTLASQAPIPGLTDGATYLVDTTGLAANQFKLQTLSGTPINISSAITKVGGRNPELGGTHFTVALSFSGHRFAHEGINLTSTGSGTQRLVIDLTGAAAGNDNGRFSGIGGAATLAGSDSGDLESVASATGKTGGAINVGEAETKAYGELETNLTIKTGVSLEANVIEVTTRSILNVTGTADGIGGGAISISGARSNASGTNTSKLDIQGGTTLTARDSILVQGRTTSDIDALAESDSGGFAGGDATSAFAYSAYETIVEIGGTLTAGKSLTVNSITDADAEAEAESDFGAFGGDADSRAEAYVGRQKNILGNNAVTFKGDTDVTIETNATLTGETLALTAQTNGRAFSDSDSDADCGFCDSDANSISRSDSDSTVTLQTMAMLNADTLVTITADQKQIIHAKALARCDCFAGGKDADATASANGTSLVTGVKDAFITTAELNVFALATGTSVTDDAATGGGFIVFGGGDGSSDNNIKRHIDWESTTILLGEPNPSIHIEADGTISELKNITGVDGQGSSLVDLFTNGTPVGTGRIVLDDIVYDQGSFVLFETDEGDGKPQSEIWGNAAIFDFQQTWDFVTIINESSNDIEIQEVNVVLPPSSDEIRINVKNVPNGSATFRVTNVGLGDTFHFEVIRSYIPTLVTIESKNQASGNDHDVVLSDEINNPIGTTVVLAQHGDIEAEDNDQLVRTNILEIDAPNGSIGFHTSTTNRTPINVELIESDFTETGEPIDPVNDPKRRTAVGTYTPSKVGPGPDFDGLHTRLIEIRANAADDIVLNVNADRYAHPARAAVHDFVITFGPIIAGDDIDIFVGDSFDREKGGPGALHVHRAKHGVDFNADSHAGVDHTIQRFFRPDCALPEHGGSPCDVFALGPYQTAGAAVTGNYLFSPSAQNYPNMTVGGTIDNGDRPTGNTAYLQAGDYISVRHLTSGQITYTGIVNADSNNNQVGSTTLLTNGFINAEERQGHFRVNDISSSDDDVWIWALARSSTARTTPRPPPIHSHRSPPPRRPRVPTSAA